MAKKTVPQNYPRITDEKSPSYGCVDDAALVPHTYKIPSEKMKQMIEQAILSANIKSSRAILHIPDDATPEEVNHIYIKEGKALFAYFKKYCGDPASTAYDYNGKHYRDVAREQFHNRTLQKERMNSGWRYQFLSRDCATESRRFRSVSDIGAAEADFNAVIDFTDKNKGTLSLYVSIKNRSNTMGGQDWPKAIHALEEIAKNDRNRTGPYCCVFGIVMDRGLRYIKVEQKTRRPHSFNTEVWLSDFFWPFFANYSYEEIMMYVLNTLIELEQPGKILPVEIPEPLIESFGNNCQKYGLINEDGYFDDPEKLVKFFCRK